MPGDGEKRGGIRKENQIRRGHGEKEKRRGGALNQKRIRSLRTRREPWCAYNRHSLRDATDARAKNRALIMFPGIILILRNGECVCVNRTWIALDPRAVYKKKTGFRKGRTSRDKRHTFCERRNCLPSISRLCEFPLFALKFRMIMSQIK